MSVPFGRIIGQQPTTSERRDLRNLAGDVWDVWTSPAHIRRRDLIPLGAAIGVVSVTALGDSVIWQWISHHQDAFPVRMLAPVRDKWLVPLNELPTAPYLPVLTVATYAAGRLSGNSTLTNAALGCTAAHVAALGFRVVTYSAVGRERPLYTPEPFHLSFPGSPSDWDLQSFTGGHVTNAMACATFLARRYSLGVAEPLLYVFAVSVGLGRMADGWHWPSDTMAGILSGYAIGAAVAHRQRARGLPTQVGAGPSATTPIPLFQVQIRF